MASQAIPRHVVLTGAPGTGKTTLIKEVSQMLRNLQVPVQGFYTEETRDEHGRRSGFDVVTFEGNRGPLARVKRRDDFPTNQREYIVGQYSVQLKEFESIAVPSLKKMESKVYVVDEIGKMELFSQSFCRTVQGLLDDRSNTVFCTIPIAKGKPLPLVDQLRNRKDIVLYEVTRQNRNNIAQEICKNVRMSYEKHCQRT